MKSQRLRALVLGCALTLPLAIGIELVAHWMEPGLVPDFSAPAATNALYPYHPFLLWEHAPGTREEIGVEVRTNSLGLRGPEPVIPKPPGLRRIVATGDSTVYGFGVPEEACFVRVAAEDLGPGFEGWAAALPGYSTLQTLNLLRLRGLRLEPDVLVIANIWSDHQGGVVEDDQLMDQAVRFDRSLAGHMDALLRHTATYRIAWWKLGVEKGSQARERLAWKGLVPLDCESVRRVPPNDYARNLEAIIEMAHDSGSEVVVMVLPNPMDTHSGSPPLSFTVYQGILLDTAARHGLPVVEGPELFRASGLSNADLWLDNIHPSVIGHLIMGNALAELLDDWADGGTLEKPGNGLPMPEYDDGSVSPLCFPPGDR